MGLSDLIGLANRTNLYLSFLTVNATAHLIFDQTLMASARVIADGVTVDEAGAAQIAGGLLLTVRIPAVTH
ncbi:MULTISPECIES: sensor histidine kinase N-terminal domain-containing protein [unclassified Rhizobium]|uniref:sensor histidine kinase N-terminal domain-containing protein n=1 Tax=unclassified Rhizobium TaxID=2613769 RepID=UPI001A997BC1|nr:MULTISPECIES: sensor histidine kinase N-terminal domain-containing protein [unclassified Rhizobium]MBX5185496.1 hypothetical protein [Rhizobium sp. NZLR5]MBX5204728.1 hypothetical protein [Rhizobium sp. NZLR1]QSZ23357.1 sensor histidine kinase N-terminal domain-containing protein [Rhizobium sp. NZLR1]